MDITYTFPHFEKKALPNGLNVIWLEDHEQPVIKIALQIPTGRQFDPGGKEGTAELAVSLAQKGAGSYETEQFSQMIESAGAQISGNVGEQLLSLELHTLQMQASEVVPLFWQMVETPAMNHREFNRLKREMLTEMQAEYGDPSSIAAKNLQVMVFGREHPGGRVHTADAAKQITLKDVISFWDNFVYPRGAILVVAGAFDLSQKTAWEKLFSQWQKAETGSAVHIKQQKPPERTQIRLIDKPELSQTTIMLGANTIGELHPDKPALSLGNYILGGGNFSSRLMNRVRSEIGKTYGIGSQLSCGKEWGLITISTTTQTHQLKDVLTAVQSVLEETFQNGVTQEELQKAKQFLLGHMAFELEGIHNVAEKLLWLHFYERDISYIERFGDLLKSIDVHAVNDALNNHFRRGGYFITAVGNKKEIEGQLSDFGDIHIRNHRRNPYA